MKPDLDSFVADRRERPFEYFEHDCVHIAADWMLAKTGKDPIADLRLEGSPLARRNLLSSLRLIQRAGGFIQAATERLGPCLPGLMAQRGDIVLAVSGGKIGRVSGYSFGICVGSHLVCPGNERLEFLPLSDGVAAWRI